MKKLSYLLAVSALIFSASAVSAEVIDADSTIASVVVYVDRALETIVVAGLPPDPGRSSHDAAHYPKRGPLPFLFKQFDKPLDTDFYLLGRVAARVADVHIEQQKRDASVGK